MKVTIKRNVVVGRRILKAEVEVDLPRPIASKLIDAGIAVETPATVPTPTPTPPEPPKGGTPNGATDPNKTS